MNAEIEKSAYENYEAGRMTIDHQQLLAAFWQELCESVPEGEIYSDRVLQSARYMRINESKILHHIQNFDVL